MRAASGRVREGLLSHHDGGSRMTRSGTQPRGGIMAGLRARPFIVGLMCGAVFLVGPQPPAGAEDLSCDQIVKKLYGIPDENGFGGYTADLRGFERRWSDLAGQATKLQAEIDALEARKRQQAEGLSFDPKIDVQIKAKTRELGKVTANRNRAKDAVEGTKADIAHYRHELNNKGCPDPYARHSPPPAPMLGAPRHPAAGSSDAGVPVQPYSAAGKTLLAQSRVSVLAPTRVPASWGTATYPTVQPYKDYKTNAQVGYDVVLGGQGCTGATACTQADVYGEKAPPVEQTRLMGKVQPTTLADGTPAKYVLGPCGANCAGSFQLQFVKGGYAYTISIKSGTLAQGLLIAEYLRPVASLP
jgi:hypothetical protein